MTLHDLVVDPGELENLAHPDHPHHDPVLVGRMLGKLHTLILNEIGDDSAPFDLNLFSTREIKYPTEELAHETNLAEAFR